MSHVEQVLQHQKRRSQPGLSQLQLPCSAIPSTWQPSWEFQHPAAAVPALSTYACVLLWPHYDPSKPKHLSIAVLAQASLSATNYYGGIYPMNEYGQPVTKGSALETRMAR